MLQANFPQSFLCHSAGCQRVGVLTGVFYGPCPNNGAHTDLLPGPDHVGLKCRFDSHRGYKKEKQQRFTTLGTNQIQAAGFPKDVTKPVSPFECLLPVLPLLPVMCHMHHSPEQMHALVWLVEVKVKGHSKKC